MTFSDTARTRRRSASASLPIVVVTGEEGAWTRFRCEHAGADAWVVKRDFRQLPDIIRRLVGDRARSKSEGPPVEPLAQLCTVLDAEANLSDRRAQVAIARYEVLRAWVGVQTATGNMAALNQLGS